MVDDRVKNELSSLRRRRLFAGSLCGTATIIVSTVLVAVYNPWHYVYLIPFGRTWVVTAAFVLFPAILGVAAWLLVEKKLMVRVIAGVVAALTVLMCPVGFWISTGSIFEEIDLNGSRTILGISPNGKFDLVLIDYINWGTLYKVVRIRSRDGLASREADQDLACFAAGIGEIVPENNFQNARFVGEYEVEVRTEAGPWTTVFDPNTLLAAATTSYGCEE